MNPKDKKIWRDNMTDKEKEEASKKLREWLFREVEGNE